MSLAAGRVPASFGGYERGSILGRGASGVVYECERTGTGKRFAAKVVDLRRLRVAAGQGADRQVIKLRREVDILRRLPSHPNLVHFEAAFHEGNFLYFIMELLMLGDLMGALIGRVDEADGARPRFHEAEGRCVAKQLVEGLRFLHGEKVIHRDLKPENVLLASEVIDGPHTFYTIKITDFGLSKVVGDGLSEAHSTVGTPIYIAPEVMANGVHGFPADCWSLGILLFVLLDGSFPYEGSPGQNQSKLDARVQQLQVSAGSKSMVSGLLQLNQDQRMTLDQALTHSWFTAPGQLVAPVKRDRLSMESREILGLPTKDLFGSESLMSSSSVPLTPPRQPEAAPIVKQAALLPSTLPTSPPGSPGQPASKRLRQSSLEEQGHGGEAQGLANSPEQLLATVPAIDTQNAAATAASAAAPAAAPCLPSPDADEPDASLTSKTAGDEPQAPSCQCGGTMCIRQRKQDGAQFWGCQRFPVCQQTKPLDIACDLCGKPMKKRNNKATANVFYGCSGYPDCKRTLNLQDAGRGPGLAHRAERAAAAERLAKEAADKQLRDNEEQEAPPSCNQCGLAMVRRCKKSSVSSAFWGCQQFPKCRQTRPLGLSVPAVNGDGAKQQ